MGSFTDALARSKYESLEDPVDVLGLRSAGGGPKLATSRVWARQQRAKKRCKGCRSPSNQRKALHRSQQLWLTRIHLSAIFDQRSWSHPPSVFHSLEGVKGVTWCLSPLWSRCRRSLGHFFIEYWYKPLPTWSNLFCRDRSGPSAGASQAQHPHTP